MLTQNEITALSLSPTKKDFVQIWNELLDVAGKLSERWDPTSTNESDPGIVLLKALTGIADKLNYSIDKNILEAFMPTVAQEESMRKLCDMLGYNMKYYRSAEAEVTIKYYNPDPSDEEAAAMADGQLIPKFTVITNTDKDISYFTTNEKPQYISINSPVTEPPIPCMEGQIVKCESNNDNNVITANQISENNRFYLPETMIAENGIFIYNVSTVSGVLTDGERWEKVDNLNVYARESKIFKFGFDSYESRPYVEFPEDYSKLFNEGIFLYYARTSGVNGNVSPRTLTQIELPSTGKWSDVSIESLSVENVFAATSGANAENIRQAYNNFKKTIGTFETLVTCRDYMNKIYSLVENGKPLVSNILVTDIRNDLNKAVTICSCDHQGIFYKDVPLSSNMPIYENTKPVFSNNAWHLGAETGLELNNFVTDSGFDSKKTGDVLVRDGHWAIKQNDVIYKTELSIGATEQAINHFDIVFYPFKSFNQIKNNVKDIRSVYDASFDYSESRCGSLTQLFKSGDAKTISHNIKYPDVGDVLSINNYLRLSATIATNAKVTADEGALIVDNIKRALANAFNMRELDFGDEIPFDSIVEVIEGADPRIKVASLNEPALYTTFSVLERRENNDPVIAEYAVASDWLDVNTADKVGRFTKKDEEGNIVSTFDTVEARKIYNKLAVRNILAGRVPLFDYNNSFTTSFSESTYQVTTLIGEGETPTDLDKPGSTDDGKEPFTIWTEGDTIYTGQYNPETKETIYTKTEPVYPDNIITEATDGDTVDNYITDIKAECKLFADEDGAISDVTLADGEFVKFRAPNFTTVKTYPAYVNYHLDLNKELHAESSPAVATSLFNVLDADRKDWSAENKQVRWQKVLDYFGSLDTELASSYKKTFTVSQVVSATTTPGTDEINITPGDSATTIGVGVNNTPIETSEYTIESLAMMSGCIKLANDEFKARVEWTPAEGESAPQSSVPLNLVLEDFANPFITNVNVIAELKTAIDTALSTYKNSLPAECLQCSFTVYLDFECVPFEAKSLTAWEGFIKSCTGNFENSSFANQVLDYIPYDEYGTIFWRLFGDGYDIGKYVTQNTEKLLKFSKNYFGLLANSANYLQGIYLIESLGADAKPVVIKNDEEYMLGSGEYLYIEYTPSTTTEEGNTKDLAAVTEIYGEGTIIRPSGFETGLMDSSVLGSTPHKDVTFAPTNGNVITKNMYRFSANEQVEIRDVAKVTLSNKDFQTLYFYKNFNGCPELESVDDNAKGSRKYTLKDGEAIFYTDKNKSEFAYFTTGTEVELTGSFTLPQFDVIELATILDSGIQAIPWAQRNIAAGDTITFQEYQYITLGPEDTIKSLVVIDPKVETSDSGVVTSRYLSDDWRFCSDVEYVVANDPDTRITLPSVNLQGNREGCGWEACSTLELDASAGVAQTLRNTDKVATSLALSRTKTTGGDATAGVPQLIAPKAGYTDATLPLAFKTNLACCACGNEISIADVWSNPNNLKGFQLKLFSPDEPVVVETKPGTVIPYAYTGDIAAWPGTAIEDKEYLENWRQVSLDEIVVAADHDNALRLPISILPNTYGVFCIYVNYTSTSATNRAKTWIEVLPGTDVTDITLLNESNPTVEYRKDTNKKKLERLYLNPGINCIRVNKSSRIFIKASSDAEGTLYFDELRLVNSLPIKYTDVDKTSVTLNTQGLNLKQLGYLDASEADSDSLDAVTKAKLQKAYVDEMYAEINNLVLENEEEFVEGRTKLIKLLPEVRVLVEAEKTIAEELKNIKTIDSARVTQLTTKYTEVKETLEKERKLLEALKNNAKADELEQSLVALLDSFGSIEGSIENGQKQILDELAELCTAAEKCLEELSDKEILEDFESGDTVNSQAIKEIKAIVINKIEEHYQEQLTAIANNLNSTVNSTSKNTLLTILANLKASATSTIRAELQTKVNELSNLVENELNGILEEIVEAAYQETPDYPRLLALLTQLRNTVSTTDIKVLVSEMAQAVSDNNDAQLEALLTDVYEAIDAISDKNTTTGEGSTVINAIDNAYDAAASKATDTKDLVDALSETISGEYITKLSNALDAVDALLTALEEKTESIDAVLANLSKVEYIESATEKTSQVQQIINQINALIAERDAFIKGINELDLNTRTSWEDNTCKDFIREAVLAIWPAYIGNRLSECLVEIEEAFATSLALTDASKLSANLAAYAIWTSDDAVIMRLLDIQALEALFTRIAPLLSTKAQTAGDIGLIENIGLLVTDSDELSKAIEACSANENKIISALIAAWKTADGQSKPETADVRQKQQLQASLKEELTKAIATRERIFGIVANMLCPNLVNLINEIDEINKLDENNGFYAGLLSRLKELEGVIIANDIDELSIANDEAYLTLFEKPLAEFKDCLANFEMPATSLLPSSIAAELSSLTKLLRISSELADDISVLDSYALDTLSSVELRYIVVTNNKIQSCFETLCSKVISLEQLALIDTGYEEAFKTLRLEDQLLAEIRAIDVNREFYYNAPIVPSFAIDLNGSSSYLNTLMNPQMNYDINNVNNSFVISKLDIDFLDSGFQIARSSRIN